MTPEELKNAIRDGLKEAIKDIKKQHDDDQATLAKYNDTRLEAITALVGALAKSRSS